MKLNESFEVNIAVEIPLHATKCVPGFCFCFQRGNIATRSVCTKRSSRGRSSPVSLYSSAQLPPQPASKNNPETPLSVYCYLHTKKELPHSRLVQISSRKDKTIDHSQAGKFRKDSESTVCVGESMRSWRSSWHCPIRGTHRAVIFPPRICAGTDRYIRAWLGQSKESYTRQSCARLTSLVNCRSYVSGSTTVVKTNGACKMDNLASRNPKLTP